MTAPSVQLRIFDSHYVAENIHSGDSIGSNQRRNLCRLILGRDGVELARRYDRIEDRIDTLNRAIREERAIINSHAGGMKTDQFIALAEDAGIDEKIGSKAREVEGLKEIDRLRAREGLAAASDAA